MFGIFKKRIASPKVYTKEGQSLYDLLQNKDDWRLIKDKNKIKNGPIFVFTTNYILHNRYDIKILDTYHSLYIKVDDLDCVCLYENFPSQDNNNILNQHDVDRIRPLIRDIFDHFYHESSLLNIKKVRDELLRHSKTNSE